MEMITEEDIVLLMYHWPPS